MKILYKVTVKQGKVDEFKELSEKVLIPTALQSNGCKLFSLFQDVKDSREFLFYELWEDEASVHEYKKRLIEALGPPRAGEEFPETMNTLIEADEDLI